MDDFWKEINICSSVKERRGGSYREKRLRKGKSYRNSEGRIVNTREYALAWGVKNRPYSSHDLYIKCRDADAPSYSFIVKKCWKGYPRYYNALVRAGMEPRPPRSDMERRKEIGRIMNDGFKTGLLEKDYNAARMAAEYGVLNSRDYLRVRKEHPELKVFLPGIPVLSRRFGSWERFKYEIMKYNTDIVLTEYVRESHRLGHWLRLRECDKSGIPIRKIMNILRPALFNVLCYRKLDAMGLDRFSRNEGN